jgi:hypothetical protein
MEQSPAAVQPRLHRAVQDLLGRRDLVGAEVEVLSRLDGICGTGGRRM